MDIYLIIITIIFSAFFSGMEIAFLSSNRLMIELEKKQGKFSTTLIKKIVNKPGRYIAAMLIGNNIALVFYGILMATVLEPILMQYTQSEVGIFLLQTLISTLIILFFGEFFPKILFSSNPNFWLSFFAVPAYIIFYILLPVSLFFISMSYLFMRILGRKKSPGSESIAFGRVDIDDYLQRFSGNSGNSDSENNDLKLFQNALSFSGVKIRECAIPRPEIVTVEIGDSIETLYLRFIETGYSKILVYRDNIDDIIGYVHSKDLLKKPQQIKNIIHEVMFVPETMQANILLSLFIKQKKSVAVVVDEFGGTNGMVTIEDILEEILGEIDDEHDTETLDERQLPDDTFIFSGRLEIDYLNSKYHFNIPDSEEYETIAGFILSNFKNIPKINESIETESYIFKILRSSQTRIELVQMKIKKE